jgi:hypothetical protein
MHGEGSGGGRRQNYVRARITAPRQETMHATDEVDISLVKPAHGRKYET